jgi:hypothetical protein
MREFLHKKCSSRALNDRLTLLRKKKASGEDTGDRPFLYLVKEDEAYVVDGPIGSAAAATAYHNICN